MKRLARFLGLGIATAMVASLGSPAQAQRLAAADLIEALQDGGYVLVMSQAGASLDAARAGRGGGGGFGFGGGGGRGGPPAPEPTEEALEQESIELLTGMRHAFWHFSIPVASIYTSPARAAVQQADEVPFAAIMTVEELGGDSSGAAWLTANLAEAAMPGSNTIVITQAGPIQQALGVAAAAGETLVVRPGGEPEIVGRVNLREWSTLAIELD